MDIFYLLQNNDNKKKNWKITEQKRYQVLILSKFVLPKFTQVISDGSYETFDTTLSTEINHPMRLPRENKQNKRKGMYEISMWRYAKYL